MKQEQKISNGVRKTILTLLISIFCLGLASFLFSLNNNKIESSVGDSTSHINSGPAKLPLVENSSLTASLNPNFIPIRDWSIEEPEIEARAAALFDLDGDKFLYQKNIKEKLPIASLTKIMTAIIALENLELEKIITISKKAVMTEGENGHLKIGEKINIRNLLYVMLMESSNDAAVALAGAVDTDFITLMEKLAKNLEMENTHFVDPTGINQENYSTISDLIRLTKYSFGKALIWQIFSLEETDIYSQNMELTHHLLSTNKLLKEIPEMVGGKTGWTEEAGGCMLTMIKIPEKSGKYLITIILGSENRELETKKLIEWAQKAYLW